jgi:hypothetical protein
MWTENKENILTQENPVTSSDDEAIYFSPSNVAFYLGRHRARFGSKWPADASVVSKATWVSFTGQPPLGTKLGVDDAGNPAWVTLPPPTDEEAKFLLSMNINCKLDTVAESWGYDKGIDNATTWMSSEDLQFAAEAKALNTWRDQVWAWALKQPAGTVSADGMPAAPTRPEVGDQQ